jgi:hypothetical protein
MEKNNPDTGRMINRYLMFGQGSRVSDETIVLLIKIISERNIPQFETCMLAGVG